MKGLSLALLVLLSAVAYPQEQQCVQSELSGEAAQGHQFNQELGQGLVFSIVPMRIVPWAWFQITIIDKSHAGYVLNMSDANWLLATPDFGSAFIGGINSDQKAALGYRIRDLLFPISFGEKEELRTVSTDLYTTKAQEEESKSIAVLGSMRLGQMKFEITDYHFAKGNPPTSLEWVKFNAVVTVPADFRLSEKLVSAKLSLRYVECPAIPDEVIENIRNPKRHEYFLASESASATNP